MLVIGDLGNRNPLFALDVEILLRGSPPKFRTFRRFSKMQPNMDAELAAIKLKRVALVALLTPFEDWQNKMIEELLEHASYNYMISVRGQGDFEMFRDNFLPYAIFSNRPKLWQGEYTDVYEYSDWSSAFNLVREQIAF